jgi:hypothetical protein
VAKERETVILEIEITPDEAANIIAENQINSLLLSTRTVRESAGMMLCRIVSERIIAFIAEGNPDMAAGLAAQARPRIWGKDETTQETAKATNP